MHWPYRVAAPPEPERTEEADHYEASLLAERYRPFQKLAFSALAGGLLATFALSSVRGRPSAAEDALLREGTRIANARATVQAAKRRVETEQNRFDLELKLAIAAPAHRAPSEPLSACSAKMGEPESLIRGRAMIPMLIVRALEQRTYWSPSIEHVQGDIRTAEALLDGTSPAAAVVYADALAQKPVDMRLGRDVILVVTKWQPPSRSSIANRVTHTTRAPEGRSAFQPGVVDGHAYVYDFHEQRIVCAGEIHATNSRTLEYTSSLDDALQLDLERQIAAAVAAPNALYAITR